MPQPDDSGALANSTPPDVPTVGGPDHDGLTGQPLAEWERDLLLEQSSAEPEGVQDAPAGDTAPAGTPAGSAVLGRALLDRDGDLWPGRPDGSYGSSGNEKEWFDDLYGPVHEVLLVSPEAWEHHQRLVHAAQAWRRADLATAWNTTAAVDDSLSDLAVAVDATVGDHPTVPAHACGNCEGIAPETCATAEPAPPVEPLSGVTDTQRAAALAEVEPAGDRPGQGGVEQLSTEDAYEPAGDGPGWNRERVQDIIRALDVPHAQLVVVQVQPDTGDQLRALLADRDEADEHARHNAKAAMHWQGQTLKAERERDEDRAEVDKLRAELATARRDAAADALGIASNEIPDPTPASDRRRLLRQLAADFRSGKRTIPVRGDLGPGEEGADDGQR